jgi:hypothetical protein
MRRFLTLVCLLCLAIPAGISISGCTRNPDANYCNGLGYGLKITDVASVTLQPVTTGISMAFGQTQQISAPTAKTCKGTSASVATYAYGSTNLQLVDISPTGNMCAGTWNRNTGGGIANYTICSKPDPLPTSVSGLPYASAFITATGSSVTSNPVEVYVHAPVTSISLVGPTSCLSQTAQATLDAQACYSSSVSGAPQDVLLCKPASVTDPAQFACPLPTINGVQVSASQIPSCTASIGTLNYNVANASVASIATYTANNLVTLTADSPGTTAITASIAGSGSSAGYFSTCPPKSIEVTLNGRSGATPVTVTQGVQQNLTTTVTDTNGQIITGLSLDYQSTNPLEIQVGGAGGVSAGFPGEASIYAICQPSSCNPSPINQVGLNGTGLSVTSNPVTIVTPGTTSAYVWFSAPGKSQYFVPIELLTGTIGSTVRLPYVPNSMIMDQTGTNLYFGSARELMIYSTGASTLTKQDTSAPGIVLAVAPNNTQLLINDPVREVFYIYSAGGGVSSSFGGLGGTAAWTPDSKTLYVVDNASLGGDHTDALYVYNVNTGWTDYSLPPQPQPTPPPPNPIARDLAIAIPGVGAFLSGSPTVAHTWCPTGTVGDYASMSFYPQPPNDSVDAQTDVLAATTDGQHILGAALMNGGITLTDIGVTVPPGECPPAVATTTPTGTTSTLQPLTIPFTVSQSTVNSHSKLGNVEATALNQVIASPTSSLAFLTYTGTTGGALLPYYVPATSSAAATVGNVALSDCLPTLASGAPNPAWPCNSTILAPIAGAFSPDNTIFFVSTAGDNMIHYISVPLVISNPSAADTRQISPNLPVCLPVADGGNDAGCTSSGAGTVVPATAIAVKPRSTT